MKNIYEVKNNQAYIIQDIPDMKLLKSLGIRKNAQVFKKHSYKLGGPVLLKVDMSEIALGKDVAEKIIVREAM